MEKDSKFRQAYNDQTESLIDFAETALLNSIRKGSDTATIFFLKTKGKDRGYIERQEHTGKDGKDLNPAKTLTKEEARKLWEELNDEY
jgi:hypothetical protein